MLFLGLIPLDTFTIPFRTGPLIISSDFFPMFGSSRLNSSSISSSEKWKNCFDNPRKQFLLNESEYYDLLAEISSDFEMWLTTYYHRMKSHNDIIEWYRGTGLRPYLEQLQGDKMIEFESEVAEQVRLAYPKQKNGDIIFRFPRLFFTATK